MRHTVFSNQGLIKVTLNKWCHLGGSWDTTIFNFLIQYFVNGAFVMVPNQSMKHTSIYSNIWKKTLTLNDAETMFLNIRSSAFCAVVSQDPFTWHPLGFIISQKQIHLMGQVPTFCEGGGAHHTTVDRDDKRHFELINCHLLALSLLCWATTNGRAHKS